MTIGLIGNMNNQLFQQQRYFEDWGYDTTLFLLDEHDHFMPEADVFFDPYQKFKIVKLGWSIDDFYKISSKTIRDLFSGFDVLIGTDLAPAYLYKGGLKLDIYCLHGSDVYEYPFYRFNEHVQSLWNVNRVRFSISQYEGVKVAKYLALYKMDELYEKPLSIIRKTGKRMASIPYLYLTQLEPSYFEQSTLTQQIRAIKEQHGFLVMHHCSHNWHTHRDSLIYKGNDRVIKAFADYYHSSVKQKKGALILLEYGPDVERSKQMINELGIANNVFWFPKQQRKNLLAAINMCDIGIGELGVQGWMLYSVIVEFLILSKPSIHYRNSPIYEKHFNGLYNMIDTNDPRVVTEVLLEFEENPGKYTEIGREGNKWFLDNLHNVSLKEFREKIEETKGTSKSITLSERYSHSNKLEAVKANFWFVYNTVKLKLGIK